MKSPRSHQVSASHSPVWPRRWHSIVQFVDQGLSPTGAEFGGRLPLVEFRLPCRRQQQREHGQEPPRNAQPGSGKSRTSLTLYARLYSACSSSTPPAHRDCGENTGCRTEQGLDFDARCVACQRPGRRPQNHLAPGHRNGDPLPTGPAEASNPIGSLRAMTSVTATG